MVKNLNSANYSNYIIACISSLAIYALTIHIDPDFYLSRLLADSFVYFAKINSIISGEDTLKLAQNGDPILYAPGASWFYMPIASLFKDYPARLHSIQTLNFLLASACTSFWLYYLTRMLPDLPAKAMSIGIALLTLIDGRWQRSIATPNADLLPALLTIIAILAGRRILSQPRDHGERQYILYWAILGIISITGYFVKFSLITLLIATGLITAIDRRHKASWTRRHAPVLGLTGITLVVILALANHSMLLSYWIGLIRVYIDQPAASGGWWKPALNTLANLMFAAVPSQVIPDFYFTYRDNIGYTTNSFHTVGLGARTMLWMTLGALVTTIVAIGAMRTWRQFRLELTMLALVLPVFAVVTNSTFRYLLPFQPVIWCFFIHGLRHLAPPLPQWARHRYVAAIALAAVVGTVLLVQRQALWVRLRDTHTPLVMVDQVAAVFGATARFLQTQDPGTTRIVSTPMSQRWLLVASIPHWLPDSRLIADAGQVTPLVVMICEKRDCPQLDEQRQKTFAELTRLGATGFTLLFARTNSVARAEIYRVHGTED